MWFQWIVITGVLIIVILGIAAIYGNYRWQSNTDKRRAKLTNGQQVIQTKVYDPKERLQRLITILRREYSSKKKLKFPTKRFSPCHSSNRDV